jgi:adenosine deaminase
MTLAAETIRALPKVVLHEHLDGGLRAATVWEIAHTTGHDLPAESPEALDDWFVHAVESGSLEEVLAGFEHTLAVLQRRDDLVRAAREQVVDLAADGVVYAESRYAPELHLTQGLTPQQVVEAVQQGLDEGTQEAKAHGHTIVVKQLLCAMRQFDHWTETAALAVANRDRGVVGFDLAGPEAGFPPTRHLEAFALLRQHSLPYTIHAGEEAEPGAIAQAVHVAGAVRIGHGGFIKDDIEGLWTDQPRLGPLADWLRDRQVHLEACPTSNRKTRMVATIAAHPVTPLLRLGFNVGVNADDRLMMGVANSDEFAQLHHEAGWTLPDMEQATVNAMRAAFVHHDERERLVADVIRPAYAAQAQVTP